MGNVFMVALTFTMVNTEGFDRETEVLLRVSENSPIGTKIGDIVTDSGLRRTVPAHQLQGMEFRFTTEPPIPLSVGPKDGMVWTRGIVDRESLPFCRSKKNCSFTLDLSVHPYEHFRIIKARVEVQDVNDNSPTFSERSIQVNILESAAVNSTYLLPPAIDPDSPMYGVQKYELVDWTTYQHLNERGLFRDSNKKPALFGLRTAQKLDGFMEVRLLLKEKLDRESKDIHWLQLTAFDGGPIPRSDTMNITIFVQDSNDNEPIFDHQSYETSIPENSLSGTKVIKVKASDADLGINGRIRYDLTSQTKVMYGQVFDINNTTGQIFVVGYLDREIHPVYQLIVTAEDEGPDSHPVDVTVTVHLEDENDNEPEITINTLLAATENTQLEEVISNFNEQGDVVGIVPENSPSGTFVAQVTVVDPDREENGTVDCFILDQTRISVETRGKSFQNHSLLRKFKKRFAQVDRGNDLNLLKFLQLQVLQDQRSKIVKCSNYCEEEESKDWINTIDSRPTLKPFRLSRRSPLHQGETEYQVLTGGHLDRESVPSGYRLTIACSDSGRPPKTSVKLMMILLADENDNDPVFSRKMYTARIQENKVAPNNPILGVSAFDADLGLNGRFIFKMDEGAWEPIHCKDAFAVDAKGGYVYAVKPIDRELVAEVRFKIMAVDSGEPPRTGTADVVILIDDVNDLNPFFSEHNYIFKILENQLPGTVVGHVSATDLDFSPDNADVRYSLIEDSNKGFFNIDSRNGSIHTSVSLNRETHPTFYFTVVAEDRGKPSLAGTSKVSVHVEDQNDNAPIFIFPSSLNFTYHVPHNFPIGMPIVSISAHDADHDSNSKIAYHLVDCRLYDEAETQKVVSKDRWDFDDNGHILDPIQKNTITNKTVVEISGDFSKSEYSLILVKNQTLIRHILHNISGIISNTSTTSVKPYFYRSGKCLAFSLDPLKGILYSKINLSDLSGRSFKLSFLAEDGGRPSLSSSANILLIINSSVTFYAPDNLRRSWGNQLFGESHSARMPQKGRSYYLIFLISTGFACLLILCGTMALLMLLMMRNKRRNHTIDYNPDVNGNRSMPSSCFCAKASQNSFGRRIPKSGIFQKDFKSSEEKILSQTESVDNSATRNTNPTCFSTSGVIFPTACLDNSTNTLELTEVSKPAVCSESSGTNVTTAPQAAGGGPWLLLNGSQDPEIQSPSTTTSFPATSKGAILKSEVKALKGILRPSPRHRQLLSYDAMLGCLESSAWNDLVTRRALDHPYCTIRHNRTAAGVDQSYLERMQNSGPKPPPPYFSRQNPKPVPKRTSSITTKSGRTADLSGTFSTVPRRHAHRDDGLPCQSQSREEKDDQNGVLVTAIL